MNMEKKSGCCCKCCTPIKTIVILVVVAVCVAAFGGASFPLFKDLYENTVKKQLVMKKGSEAYKNWASPPAPVFMEYYIFNYTNYNDVINHKAKPNVTQLGPYRYREVRSYDILHSDDNTITYLQNYSYIFDPISSCTNCTENDTIVCPNVPILTVAKMIHDLNVTVKSSIIKTTLMKTLNGLLKLQSSWKLFKKLTVRKLLWGYTEPFLEDIDILIDIIDKLGGSFPQINPFIALQHNATNGALATGNITIRTGALDIDYVQNIIKWRGRTTAPYWKTKYGNMINGSDGTHFQPFLKRDQVLYSFVTDLCRSLYFNYKEDRTTLGINLYRYHTTAKLFANHTANPDNAAFCNKEKCWGSGLLPVGQCQEGNPPIFMSAPHFYQGYPQLVEAINGLHPVERLHATFLDVEPITGITMEAHKRLQINVLAQRDDFITLLQHLSDEDNFLPVMWVHEGAIINQESADKFKHEVLLPRKILTYATYGLLGLGGLFLILAVVVGIVAKNRTNDYSKFDDKNEVI